jgi:hypothetical protein
MLVTIALLLLIMAATPVFAGDEDTSSSSEPTIGMDSVPSGDGN